MRHSILKVDVTSQKVMGLRRTGRYEEIGSMIKEVFSCISERRVSIIGPPAYICHEETLEEVQQAAESGNADLEVAFPIEGDAEGCGEVFVYELSGGKMARIIHMGPYRESIDTYHELFEYLAKNGLAVNGPIREVYINDPMTTEEDLLVTWIYAPIVDAPSHPSEG